MSQQRLFLFDSEGISAENRFRGGEKVKMPFGREKAGKKARTSKIEVDYNIALFKQFLSGFFTCTLANDPFNCFESHTPLASTESGPNVLSL